MAQPAVALLCVAVFLQDVGKGRGVLCLRPGEGTWGKRPARVPVLEDFSDDSPPGGNGCRRRLCHTRDTRGRSKNQLPAPLMLSQRAERVNSTCLVSATNLLDFLLVE